MTSKHLFIKVMGEDLRHKIWMIVLSVLGNFLLLPVVWLITKSNRYRELAMFRFTGEIQVRELLTMTFEFFGNSLPVLGGLFCIVSAFVSGLFSFRFVFHKNMVDSWHSMPVRRRTLYGACYLNGILIWFIPFFLCMTTVLFMTAPFVRQQGGNARLLELLGQAAVTTAVLTVVYLLVYHLVLTAVMLSGNILNTLVCTGILGFGVIIYHVLIILFFMEYMDTFYMAVPDIADLMYASPLVSAPRLIFFRADGPESISVLWKALALNLGIALVLGACAYYLYLKRESELAEQGIRREAVSALFRVMCGVGAGMAGWFFFSVIATYSAKGWGIFGALLGTVLVYGVLDVIFRMEFRAFFAHKLQMAMTAGLALTVCSALSGDWFGYDTRLPAREEIAEIAIWNRNYAHQSYSLEMLGEGVQDRVGFQDMEIVYPYLERMVEHERGAWPEGTGYDRVLTRVTLKNGRSYYRSYRVRREDRELIWPMLMDERYVEYAYMIDEAAAEHCTGFDVETRGKVQSFSGSTNKIQEAVSPIMKGYNQDMLADRESVMLGEGRLLARVAVSLLYPDEKGDMRREDIYMDVYEGMEHTLEALRQVGLGDLKDAEEGDVETVVLSLKSRYELLTAQEEAALGIVCHEGAMTKREALILAEASYGVCVGGKEGISGPDPDAPGTDTLYITEPDEIEELLPLLSFTLPFRSEGVFRRSFISVQVNKNDGTSEIRYIRRGDLPEKYILRFGE